MRAIILRKTCSRTLARKRRHKMQNKHVERAQLCGDERRFHERFTVPRTVGEEAAKYDYLPDADKQYHDGLADRPLQHPAVQPFSERLALRLTQPVMRLIVDHRLKVFMDNARRHLHLQQVTHQHRYAHSCQVSFVCHNQGCRKFVFFDEKQM